ncbi:MULTISPECIES: co-chaperone DjlA [unclassified Wenzhouxiangella]|uniref:co-chaperone DjlA n=1 Tax=unclassified Wenzhouxiangella TaxID=2613841 RepID=UPI000E3250B4|nr:MULTISPECIES: co-chaperone DjlA [unclassified Wenzhouxiangella]RFF26998.1 co-chaperone DjlA [Wenzhouxiangella sp. 15181]RFP69510.1 co-chaperone DjlA [Wenzhouxiangella sp. 15190]
MSLFILIGGMIGLFAGGFGGLLLGAAMGYGVGYLMSRVLLPHGLGAIQRQFLDSTFAVMGALCKADGHVTRDEIRVAEQYFGKLGLSKEQRQAARNSFNRGKEEGFDLAAEIELLRGVVRNNQPLLQLFLQIQLSAIAADGVLHDDEREMLLRVARLLGLSELDVKRLEATLRGASSAGVGGAGVPDGKSLEDAYAALGVDSSASDAEVKKAYRRLMSKYHPDKLASSGMPENMRTVAEERVRDIRKAYDRIKEHRDRQQAA